MDTQSEKQTIMEQMKEEMAKWQTKMDEAKVQLNLAAKEAKDKIQPEVEKLEQELKEADAKWKQIQNVSENAWQDIHRGLKVSFEVMRRSFGKAEEHFKDKKDSK